jgi:serine/threonine protein kinase
MADAPNNSPSSRPKSASRPSQGSQPGVNLPQVTDFIGRALGKYTVVEKIGQGGMGMVFLAYDSTLDRDVAVKVMYVNPLDDQKQFERFLREARSLARMQHPNLVHVYDVGQEVDCYYFAMELLQGETLSSAIRRGPISAQEFVPALGQILSALQYVHELGITHRDIKSGNIMLCDGRAVLMDFGLAKDEQSAGLTSVGAVMGTPDYMPPELAEGLANGPPTDLYSLGVVTFEALCGRLPFTGRSALSIIRQHVDAPVPSLASFNPHIDPVLTGIVHKLLQKKPEDRYPNCHALAKDLLRFMPTPELTQLADGRPRTGANTLPRGALRRSSGAMLLRPSEIVALKPKEAARQLAAELAAGSPEGGTIADGAAPNQGFADAATVVSQKIEREPAQTRQAAEEVHPIPLGKPWPWWMPGAVGFFGVLFIFLLIAFFLNRNRQQASQPQPAPAPVKWTGQPAVHKKADGTVAEEIRWIEFHGSDPDPAKWTDVIERKQPDGSWKQFTIPHSEFAGKGDVFEFKRD